MSRNRDSQWFLQKFKKRNTLMLQQAAASKLYTIENKQLDRSGKKPKKRKPQIEDISTEVDENKG